MSIVFFKEKLESLRENRNRLEDFLNTGNKVDGEFVSKIEDANTRIFNQVDLEWRNLSHRGLSDDEKKKCNQFKEQIDAEINECNRIIRAASRNITSEDFTNWGKLFSQIGLVMGFLLIWAYCFFQINYFPSGFSIGEISFLVFVSLGFGLLFFVCTCLLWFSAFLLMDLHTSIKKLDTKPTTLKKDKIDIGFNVVTCSFIIWFWFLLCQAALGFNGQQESNYLTVLCLLGLASLIPLSFVLKGRFIQFKWLKELLLYGITILLVVIFIVYQHHMYDLLYPLFSIVIILMIWSLFWISKKFINYDAYFKIICHFIIVCVVLLIFNSVTSSVFYMTFEALGIKHNQISISLSEDDHKKVKALAKEQNLPLLFSCEDENQTILNHTNVLWNGIGEHILLGIPSLQKNQDVATIEVKKSDSKILRGLQSNKGCTYHKLEKAFESGQIKLNHTSEIELVAMIDKWRALYGGIRLKEIHIDASADLTPDKSKQKDVNNLSLSELRAAEIHKLMIEKLDCNEMTTSTHCADRVVSQGLGNTKASVACLKTGHDKKDAVDCRADDRSVLIKLKWEVPKNNNKRQ